MEHFNYKGTFVAVRSCHFRSRNHEDGRTCWCCQEEFKDNDECVILINNYKYIPNMLLHKDCFYKVEPDCREIFCESIENDYKEYKEFEKIFN